MIPYFTCSAITGYNMRKWSLCTQRTSRSAPTQPAQAQVDPHQESLDVTVFIFMRFLCYFASNESSLVEFWRTGDWHQFYIFAQHCVRITDYRTHFYISGRRQSSRSSRQAGKTKTLHPGLNWPCQRGNLFNILLNFKGERQLIPKGSHTFPFRCKP